MGQERPVPSVASEVRLKFPALTALAFQVSAEGRLYGLPDLDGAIWMEPDFYNTAALL